MKESTENVGWIYHYSPVITKKEPKLYPPLSNIAGLGIHSDDCYEEKEIIRSSFKSTDTPYQTLCKMGGYQDLLYHKENDLIKKPPVPYPRCDWFYLEDLEIDHTKPLNCAEPKKYVFQVPDYMVTQENKKKEFKCVDEYIPQEKVKKKRIHKKLPDNRPGYSDYTKQPVKLTFARREYPSGEKVSFPKVKLEI